MLFPSLQRLNLLLQLQLHHRRCWMMDRRDHQGNAASKSSKHPASGEAASAIAIQQFQDASQPLLHR